MDAKPVLLARYAMGTKFELAMYGERQDYLRDVGEEVFKEIERLEAQLSFYRPTSDISVLNARAAREPVPVDPRLFALLERAQRLSEASGGAFDITVAPLLRCWGFVGSSGQMPTEAAVAAAREVVGMQHVHLDRAKFTVHFDREGVMLDLGAIGKGYGIECAVELLREFEITSALLHGGTSTAYAIGAPPGEEAWKIAIQRPFAPEGDYLAYVALCDRALSVSAPHGKWFEANGRRYGHIIDPRTGYPASRNVLAVLVTASATESDALSTALLTLGADWLPSLIEFCPDAQALVAAEGEEDRLQVVTHGLEIVEKVEA